MQAEVTPTSIQNLPNVNVSDLCDVRPKLEESESMAT